MSQRALLTIAVDFDETKTDAESVAAGLDAMMETAFAMARAEFESDYGSITAGDFMVAAGATSLPPLDLDVTIGIKDAGDETDTEEEELRVRIRRDAFGVCVDPLNDTGEPLGSVILDYHGNALKGVVVVGWDKEPSVIQLISADVRTQRKAKANGEPPAT